MGQIEFAGYELDKPLGAGGFAQVWRARSPTGELVALKILKLERGTTASRRAEVEGQLAAKIDSPHVLVPQAVVEENDGRLGLVLELCRGSLTDWQVQFGPLSPAGLVAVGSQLCAGLRAAHDAGVIHRDVKPSNLLVAHDGTVKLADFGIATVVEATQTASTTSELFCSLPFAAPERRYGQRGDVRSDLYSAGVTLIRLALPRLDADPYAPVAIARVRAALPAPLAEVLLRATAAAPEDRYASAAELAQALAELDGQVPGERPKLSALRGPEAIDTLGVAAAPLDPIAPEASSARSPLTLVAVAAASIVASVGATTWALRESAPAAAEPREPTLANSSPTPSPTPPPIPRCPDAMVAEAQARVLGPRETVAGTLLDLDDDGAGDLVFTNQLDETLSIYWGGPDGVPLVAPTELPVGRSNFYVAAGDVDEDGRVDVVVNMPDEGKLRLLRGLGDRRFAAAEDLAQTPPSRSVDLLDWDADGHLDLLLRTLNDNPCTALRRGDGRGGFAAHRCIGPVEPFVHRPFGRHPAAAYRIDGARVLRYLPGPDGLMSSPSVVATLAAPPLDLFVTDADDDGVDEVYTAVVDLDRLAVQVDRIAAPGQDEPCRVVGLALGYASLAEIADVDGDHNVDFIYTDTCAGCTSNHGVLYGVPAPD